MLYRAKAAFAGKGRIGDAMDILRRGIEIGPKQIRPAM